MLREYEEQDRVAWGFPWSINKEEHIVMNKNYSYTSTFKFRGFDLDSSTVEELEMNLGRLNNYLKRLGENWTLHIEARRFKSKKYMRSQKIKEIPVFIVETEREEFFSSGEHYESGYYLSLTYKIPVEKKEKFLKLFLESDTKVRNDLELSSLQYFKDEINTADSFLKSVFKEIKLLTTDEIVTYFHSCISDTDFEIKLTENQKFRDLYDGYISDCEVVGGLEPIIGSKFLGAVSIYNFPDEVSSTILDKLNRLPLEYRFVTRFITLGKQEAHKILDSYMRTWGAKEKSIGQMVKETFTNEETKSKNINLDAKNKSEELAYEKQALEADEIAYGFYTANIMVMNEDKEELQKALKIIKNTLNQSGFLAEIESIHSEEVWLGSLPGNSYHNVRRPPMNTALLTTLLPTSAIWAGDEYNAHLEAPSLFYAQTSGNTPFRANIHFGDVGHTLIAGPTGAGKSVLLAFMAAQYKKYPHSQVFTFDKGASTRTLTKAIGGSFYDLGEDDLRFQPLAKCNEPKEMEWCQEWIENILESENIELNPLRKQYIWNALQSVAIMPLPLRTLSAFANYVGGQETEIKQALAPYIGQGPYAKYFDGNEEKLSNSMFQVFEMEKIAQSKKAIAPCLEYLFHKIETERLDGKPTLILLDECWLFFDNPKFEAKIREWLKVLRKKNAAVVFATQSLSDIANSNILSAVLDACYTRIYLPNPNASRDREIYTLFGLNNTEINIVQGGIPKRQYFLKCPKGSRLFELALSPLEIAYVATSGEEDQQKTKELKELKTREFNVEWLKFKGFDGEMIIENVERLMNI